MRTLKIGVGAAIGLALSAGALGYVAARGGATPIAESALVYSGTLTDGNGRPLSGQASIGVSIWTAQAGGEKLCETPAVSRSIEAGAFEVILPVDCNAKIRTAASELWASVDVDDAGVIPRSRLSPVPLALEAAHAQEAEVAAPDGGLDLKLKRLEEPFSGTYPAILMVRSGGYDCLPDAGFPPLDPLLGVRPNNGTPVFTDQGEWTAPLLRDTGNGKCAAPDVCVTPLTFLLNNPEPKKVISLKVYLDDHGAVYVDNKTPVPTTLETEVKVEVPTGPFALTFLACSTNGTSVDLRILSKFITENRLNVDYDRTFHRKGT